MNSFKTRLVAYFLVLSLLPLTAAFFGFSAVARRSESRRVDARLQAGLRAGLGALQDDVRETATTAAALARDVRVQAALRDRNRRALQRLSRAADGLDVRIGPRAPDTNPLAVTRSVDVVLGRRVVGRVSVSLTLDQTVLRRLAVRSGVMRPDLLVVVHRDRVAAAPSPLLGLPLVAPGAGSEVIELAGTRYRALATDPLPEPRGASLVALSPQRSADAAAEATERRLLYGLAASLGLIGLVAYLLSRTVVGRLRDLTGAANAIAAGRLDQRVPANGRDEFAQLGRSFNAMAAELEARVEELEEERGRLRDATIRFGEALAATHDIAQLRQLIVETAVEVTGASGGVLAAEDATVEVGDLQGGGDRLEFPLMAGRTSFGTLALKGEGFTIDSLETAASFAAQAVVALENARLHQIVEHQALVDPLTGLGNRRAFEAALRAELSRGERFGSPVALVLADLDHFKDVNDAFGHPVGDAVLREFAALIRDTVREVDAAGRFGGEEFAILLPGTDVEGAAQLAERIREGLETRPILVKEGERVPVTASFGVAGFPEHALEEELVEAADTALYRAKALGRNRVERADGGLVPSPRGSTV